MGNCRRLPAFAPVTLLGCFRQSKRINLGPAVVKMREQLVERLPRNIARNARPPVFNPVGQADLVEIAPQFLLLNCIQLSRIVANPPKVSLQSHNPVGQGLLHTARIHAERQN
jgi:hypothetical protein